VMLCILDMIQISWQISLLARGGLVPTEPLRWACHVGVDWHPAHHLGTLL